jgi:imidazolonepropionase
MKGARLANGRCSFCGLRRSEVSALVVGVGGVAICISCATIAARSVESYEPPVEVVYSELAAVITNDPRIGPGFGRIEAASIVVRGDHVAWLGRSEDLPARYHEYPEVACDGRLAIPGFIDAGSELLGRVPTERPDPDRLIGEAAARIKNALRHGVTALDLRVGGSGDPTTDTVLLAAARAGAEVAPEPTVSITWVASHRFDLASLDGVMAPTVGRIASSVEMSCDGSEDAAELRSRLSCLRRLPARVRLCREWPAACAALAEGARSVETSEWTLLPSDATPILEPMAMLDGLRLDARALWDAGGRPGIATRSNPDGRAVNGLTLAISLLATLGGLDVGEAIWAATRGGAKALGDDERGRLRMGDPADFVVLDSDDPMDLVRRPDSNPAWKVVAGGREALE